MGIGIVYFQFKKLLTDILDVFNRAGYTVLTHVTAGPGDGETAVLRYSTQVDLIVCCGGVDIYEYLRYL